MCKWLVYINIKLGQYFENIAINMPITWYKVIPTHSTLQTLHIQSSHRSKWTWLCIRSVGPAQPRVGGVKYNLYLTWAALSDSHVHWPELVSRSLVGGRTVGVWCTARQALTGARWRYLYGLPCYVSYRGDTRDLHVSSISGILKIHKKGDTGIPCAFQN